MITKAERERDKAICEAATPGPWFRRGSLSMDPCVESGAMVNGAPRMTADIDGGAAGDVEARANADFIATARERLPAYIADAEEMERRIAKVERALAAQESGERAGGDSGRTSDGLHEALRILRGEQ